MAIITGVDLLIYLDLQSGPTDRLDQIADLVTDAINRVAGSVLTAPYAPGIKPIALAAAARMFHNPTGLWNESIDDYSASYPRTGSLLTAAEQAEISSILGTGGPVYSFPAPDWHWDVVATVVD